MKHTLNPHPPLKLPSPHLLKLNVNKVTTPKLNIQKEHFHFYKMKNHLNTNQNINLPKNLNLNENRVKQSPKLKLISSNGQNYFCFNNKCDNEVKILSNKEIIHLPHKNINSPNEQKQIKELTTIESDNQKPLQYRKIPQEQMKRLRQLKTMTTIANTITDSNSITKDETRARMERSKSTLNTKSISLRKNSKLKVLKRSLSNKRNVLQILDNTIKELNKLKTIIIDDNDEDDENYDSDDYNNSDSIVRYKKKNKMRQKLQNGIQNVNELLKSSFANDILMKTKDRKILNRTIDIDNSNFYTPKSSSKKKKDKIVINMENHKNNMNFNFSPNLHTTKHYKVNSHFMYTNYSNNLKNYTNKIKRNNDKTASLIRVDNIDKEIPIKIKTLTRNNSQLVKNIMTVNNTLNNMKKNNKQINNAIGFRIGNRYSNESDALANFEFSD